jgi:hypothetical protein
MMEKTDIIDAFLFETTFMKKLVTENPASKVSHLEDQSQEGRFVEIKFLVNTGKYRVTDESHGETGWRTIKNIFIHRRLVHILLDYVIF